ncbi:MAG TPA: biotin/lipoyl-containing protein [Pyrinomonadaceae bacterium]|nr:biotin/lipoyl-containing protein [Pyrinomonadaceae bacterium]
MNLIIDINGEKRELEIKRDGSRVVAKLGGRHYELEALDKESGVYLLLHEGRVYECRVDQPDIKREALEVAVGNQTYNVNLTDPKRLRTSQQPGAHSDSTAQIVAPMPGKVVRVLVEQGAEVEAGDGLVVVEAMKMQNEMKSPKTGIITIINVKAGATVNGGDVLAVVE